MDKFIEGYIKQFLFEEEASTEADMLKYMDDEITRTNVEINNDNRIKSAQINPDERKIKETNIKKNKERLVKMKEIEVELKKQQELKKKQDQIKLATQKTTINTGQNTPVAENIGAPVMTRSFAEQAPMSAPTTPPVKKKAVRVMFDKSTGSPFYVDFSERGFAINGTRLSFETIESALSKEYNIVLGHGSGLTLDQVRMQKILKYKDRF